MTYKLFKDSMGSVAVVFNDKTNVSFRIDGNAPEKAVFIVDVLADTELQDVDGSVMTQEEATNFIGTLP